MACDRYFIQECKSFPDAAAEDSKETSACFDCNICLDFARDPVVTLCGHLYCWPCIYNWIDLQSTSNELPQCPVCKGSISEKTMVPLYGRGQMSLSQIEPECKAIPPRPPAYPTRHLSQNVHNYHNHYDGLLEEMDIPQPVVGMFGEMVYARLCGNAENLYAYPNSYHLAGSSTPRLRRQQLQADKSLSRISVFLFCCFLLCLLLF